MDVLAHTTMKDAANCDKQYDLQTSAIYQTSERNKHTASARTRYSRFSEQFVLRGTPLWVTLATGRRPAVLISVDRRARLASARVGVLAVVSTDCSLVGRARRLRRLERVV